MDGYTHKTFESVTGCLILVKCWKICIYGRHNTYHLKGWSNTIMCIISDQVGVRSVLKQWTIVYAQQDSVDIIMSTLPFHSLGKSLVSLGFSAHVKLWSNPPAPMRGVLYEKINIKQQYLQLIWFTW